MSYIQLDDNGKPMLGMISETYGPTIRPMPTPFTLKQAADRAPWQCPKCSVIYAPHVDSCSCCKATTK